MLKHFQCPYIGLVQPRSLVGIMDPALLAAAAKSGAFSFDNFDFNKEAKRKRKEKRKRDEDSDSEDDNESSEDPEPKRRKGKPVFTISWTNPPDALRTRKDAKDMTKGQYVEHFARFVIGKWEAELLSGKKIEATEKNRLAAEVVSTFRSKDRLQQTKDSIVHLIEQCQKGKAPDKILGFLEKIASLAAEKEYGEAVKAYIEMTVGKKAFHQPMMQEKTQQNHGGGIKKIIAADADTEFDKDPVVNLYCQNCKRLVQFLQYLAPNPKIEKNSF